MVQLSVQYYINGEKLIVENLILYKFKLIKNYYNV